MFHISVYFVWLAIYLGNCAVNMFLWFQLDVENDLHPFLVWFAYTIIVFIVRLVSVPHGLDVPYVILSHFINGN